MIGHWNGQQRWLQTLYLLLVRVPLSCATKPAVDDSKVSADTHWLGLLDSFNRLVPFLLLHGFLVALIYAHVGQKGTSVVINLFGKFPCKAMNWFLQMILWFNFKCQRHSSFCSLSSFVVRLNSSSACAPSSKFKGMIGSMAPSARLKLPFRNGLDAFTFCSVNCSVFDSCYDCPNPYCNYWCDVNVDDKMIANF